MDRIGDRLQLAVRAMAHGGEGIADAPDGRVVFIRGAVPGDTVDAELVKVKKRWARAELRAVVEPSPLRVPATCPAAAAGAGCCDYAHIAPHAQAGLKREVLAGQLATLSGRSGVLEGFDLDDIEVIKLEPLTGWRTRVRLGVDSEGRAGLRRARSTEVVASETCTQPVAGLLEGVAGSGADARFTPDAELVAVMDANGQRHIVETMSAQRGRRVELIERTVEGTEDVVERVRGAEFVFPATAFWQAHARAAEAYSDIVAAWGRGDYATRTGWDLYGGVGAFVPAISDAIGGGLVESVDYSGAAASRRHQGLATYDAHFHHGKVEDVVAQLPAPGLVVLDPPRSGAGAGVIEAIAEAKPERVIHIGCDPATFARDAAAFGGLGFVVKRLALVDAFPNTHHFEVIAQLEPAHGGESAV